MMIHRPLICKQWNVYISRHVTVVFYAVSFLATRWYLNWVSWAPPIEHQLLGINPWRSSMSGAFWSMSLLISVYDLYHAESRSIHGILFISCYIYLSIHFIVSQKSLMLPTIGVLFDTRAGAGLACRQEISEEVMSRIRLAEDAWSKRPENL